MQTHYKSGDPQYGAFEEAVERCNVAAGGRLVIKLHPAGAIVTAGEELMSANKGAIDAGENSFAYLKGLSEVFSPLSQVSGGLTAVQFSLWVEYEGRDIIQSLFDKYMGDLQYVWTQVQLGEVWIHTSKPIKVVDDLKNIKMRATGDGAEILDNMGMPTVYMPSSEIYESAQRGVIDACESNTFYVDYARGFHEIAKYHYTSYSRAPMTEGTINVYKPKWEALTPDLQQIVMDAFNVETARVLAPAVALEGEYAQKYIDYGCIVEPLPVAVEQAYIEAAREYYAAKRAADPEYDMVLESMFRFKDLCDALGVR